MSERQRLSASDIEAQLLVEPWGAAYSAWHSIREGSFVHRPDGLDMGARPDRAGSGCLRDLSERQLETRQLSFSRRSWAARLTGFIRPSVEADATRG